MVPKLIIIFSKRMTSKECLRHPWLAKKSRAALSGSAKKHVESPTSPLSSHSSQKNLRKYMSKSREALFERVSSSNLPKNLSKSRERLCESQFSLVSKSREKLLMLEPSARSIEKLYGLRSLSKSQDALSTKELFALSPALASQHRMRYQSECFNIQDTERISPRTRSRTESYVSTPEIKITEPDVRTELVAENGGQLKSVCVAPAKNNNKKSSGQNGDAPKNLRNQSEELEDNKENQIMVSPPQEETVTKEPEAQKEEVEDKSPSRRSGRKSRSPTSSDEEEPRYSVAQLVTAFNKNDQMAANSAKTYDKTLPSKLKFVSSFPTGANALRLFIPDIVIAESNRKRSPVSKMPGSILDPLTEVKEHNAASHENTHDDEKGLDDRNNNTGSINPYGHFLKVSGEESRVKDTNRPFNRSSSLSSEASGYDTLSAASSLVSLEEPSPPSSLNPVVEVLPEKEAPEATPVVEDSKSSPEPMEPKPRTQRPRSSSLQVDSLRPLWGTVCVGSYNRAMERFNNKSGQPGNERQRRKSSPLIKTPRN
jgi:serine/threonine-protein kinase GIN4